MSDKKDVKLGNVPSLSVGKAVDILSTAYTNLIKNNLPVKFMPSVMLWGPPGVGKSQAIRQIAKEIETSTGKKTCVTDVRLLLFNPIDLRGIPTSNADKTLAVWLKPQIFQMDESEDVINILFLDEISAAPQSVQAAAYQITLDRVIGEHKLPENCIVLAAGNRTTDKSVAVKMPKALANRLLHLEIKVSFDSWKQWAIKSGINPTVLGFLDFRQSYLMNFDANDEDLAFSTPRSWEMVSNILNFVNGNVSEVYSLICGLVGNGVASELISWSKIYSTLPDIEKIFAGETQKVPESTDALYALVASMTAYAGQHKEDINKITNSIKYSEKLPPDFSAVLLKNYMYIEKDYKKKLIAIPEFARWLNTKGALMNGNIK